MMNKRVPAAARHFPLAALAILSLFLQSPGGNPHSAGGLRSGAGSSFDPLPAPGDEIGWSGTITISNFSVVDSKSERLERNSQRTSSTIYTVYELPHTPVDESHCDRWEAAGIVTFSSRMASKTSNKDFDEAGKPDSTYDETEEGGGGGKMYLRLISEDKRFHIDIFPTTVEDPRTHEEIEVGDSYKATAHGVSWVRDRKGMERIETTEQRVERPDLTGGTFDTLQPSGCNTVRLSGTRTVSDGKQTRTISWNLSRIGLEIMISPPKDLSMWVPKGSPGGGAGSSLTFTGEVRKRGGGTGGGRGDQKSKVALSVQLESSDLSGICGNYPQRLLDEKGKGADLRILRNGTSPGFHEITDSLIMSGDYGHGIVAKGEFAVGEKFTFTIGSFDYAAFGRLTLDSPVPVSITGYPGPEITFPVDENRNRIADFWEKKNVAPSANSSVSADEDRVPQGAGPGDGLSLFEEYRGFMVKGKHVRTNPLIKDLFVSSAAPGPAEKGVDLFGKLTAIRTHKVRRSEMDVDQAVNFQVSLGHIVDQKGVFIRIATQEELNTSMDPNSRFKDPGGMANYRAKWIKLLKDSTDAETIAHELGHTVQILHHGIGAYDLTLDGCPGPVPPAVCARKSVARAALQPFASALGVPVDGFFIAVMHGEHSGPLECIMRYNSADFIETSPGVFDLYGPAEPRTMLCNGTRGTKCGDAFIGECRKQIRVSDKGI